MKTKRLPGHLDSALQEAAELLQAGETVAFPTDTVYGLGAHARSADAVKKIYEAKGRPLDKALIILICDKKQLQEIASDIPETAQKLMDAFWPGPLTLVFKQRQDTVPDYVTRGLKTVAVRMPNHPVALQLLQIAGIPIAAPSANLSGHLDGRIAAVVDGGPCSVGVASTILDISGDTPVILRHGTITREQIEQATGLRIQDAAGSASV